MQKIEAGFFLAGYWLLLQELARAPTRELALDELVDELVDLM